MAHMAKGLGGAVVAVAILATPAVADGLGLPLEGSFGENGFDRYVPPLTNPIFNETPFITTEVKPLYAYHETHDDFAGGGANVQVLALQARLAITEELGFIATTDGYTWIDWDSSVGLDDENGWNDIAIGLKYAFLNNPQEGQIATAGLRYTIPVGNLDVDELDLDLNGIGAGYINPFVSGAKLWDKTQVQGMLGAQIALDSDATTSLLASGHVDYEVSPGFYPMLETHLFIPIDGGEQIDTGTALDELTGADIIDLGSSDPETVWTIGGGVRYAFSDNAMLGLGGDYNVLEDDNHAYGWRLLVDLVLHY